MSPQILKFVTKIMLLIALWSVTECNGSSVYGKKIGRKKLKRMDKVPNVVFKAQDVKERVRELNEIQMANRDRESQLCDDFDPKIAFADSAGSQKRIAELSEEIESNRLVMKLIDEMDSFLERGPRHSSVVEQKEFFALINALAKADVADHWRLSTDGAGSHAKLELNAESYTISSQMKKVHLHSLVTHIKSIIEKRFDVQSIDELLLRETLQLEEKSAAEEELAQQKMDFREQKRELEASLAILRSETADLEAQKAQISSEMKQSLRRVIATFERKALLRARDIDIDSKKSKTSGNRMSPVALRYLQIENDHLPRKLERQQDMARVLRTELGKCDSEYMSLCRIDPIHLTVSVTDPDARGGRGRNRGPGRGSGSRYKKTVTLAVFCEQMLAMGVGDTSSIVFDRHEFSVAFEQTVKESFQMDFFVDLFRKSVTAMQQWKRQTDDDELDKLQFDVNMLFVREGVDIDANAVALSLTHNIPVNARNLVALCQLIRSAQLNPDPLQRIIRTDELKDTLRQKMGGSMNHEWYHDTDAEMVQFESDVEYLVYKNFKAMDVRPLVGIDDVSFVRFVDKLIDTAK